jgi:hypothetical protein
LMMSCAETSPPLSGRRGRPTRPSGWRLLLGHPVVHAGTAQLSGGRMAGVSDMAKEQSVIGMLTAYMQAASEMPDEEASIPADLERLIAAPAEVRGSVTVQLPGDPITADEVRQLCQQAVQEAVDEMEGHYGRILAYLVFLFASLADEARPAVDVSEFLQRQALSLASEEQPPQS